MTGRPHKERLLADLAEIRGELIEVVAKITARQIAWAPANDMKSYRALLQEIGGMEAMSIAWLQSRQAIGWHEAIEAVWLGASAEEALAALGEIRARTQAYLNDTDEDGLEAPIPTPEAWHRYFGPEIEPEELVRWIARHEYYHLGQIITYRWMQGHNPYGRKGMDAKA